MKLLKKITTAAAALALSAGLLVPTASAACPYTVGPLGRYIVPAQVLGMYADRKQRGRNPDRRAEPAQPGEGRAGT